MKISAHKIGWIGIRVEKIGGASKMLKKLGGIRINHAQPNNRNAFDIIFPVKKEEEFLNSNWARLSQAGLVGVAFWISDAQWGKNDAITDKQWQRRAIVEAKFNEKFPTGRRN